jgi:hypothetical protein
MALDPITAVLDIGGKLIDRFFPDPAQRDAAKLELLKMQQNGELAQLTAETDVLKGQLAVNQTEASNASVFVSGWRPAIGWVCAFALLYVSILEPMARFAATVWLKYSGAFPVIDTTVTFQLLFGMLGIAGMRSFEKVRGVASK